MMGSTLRRLWIHYSHSLRKTHKVVLLVTVAILCFLFVPRLFGTKSTKSPYGVARYKIEPEEEKMDASEIRRILDLMVDTRPHQCRDHAYEFTRLDTAETVSIIVEFHGASFYHLKLALTAIVEHTPYDLYTEIIVLDDGTENESIRKQVSTFLHDPKFNKAKMFRSEAHEGQSASWFKASMAATGSILIFIDSKAVVNQGWIQPLIAKLIDSPNLIAVPHADNLLDDDRFYRTDDNLVNVVTWSLSTVYFENAGDSSDVIDLPVARGDVLAVHKSFLESIGGFDERLKDEPGAGEHVELSLRAWLCGGAIRVVTCSRMAVRNSLRPRRISNEFNYRHVTELWFDEFKNVVYRQGGITGQLSDDEKHSLAIRREYLHKKISTECKSFSWYLNNIVRVVIAPSDDARYFGKLRAMTGYCIHSDESGLITMSLCREYMYEPEAMFEMGSSGAIFRGDHCLQPDANDRIVARQCSEDNSEQTWRLQDSRLTLPSSPGKCMAQVSERDHNMDLFHYVQLVKCSELEADLRKQKWKFLNF